MNIDISRLDAFLQDYAKDKNVPGMSVSVTGPDGDIFSKAYGFCDLEKTRPVSTDTIFGIASMSKSVTCTCLAILQMEGKLNFRDPVYKYLPDFSIPGTPREAILVHHLANMTSGLPPLPTLMLSIGSHTKLGPWLDADAAEAIKRLRPSFATVGEIIEYIAHSDAYEPLGAPGEYVSYSNDCYALLSAIVDIASGSTLEKFAYERIFAPLGMTRTTFDLEEAKAMGNITSLFTTKKEQLYCTDDWTTAPPYRGCGWLKSTSVDMCKYYETLASNGIYRGKRILPEGCVSLMVGGAFPETADSVYCYGLNKRVFRDTVICEHAGSLIGISSKGGFFKGKGYAAVVLMNMDDVDVNVPINAVYNTLLGLPIDTSHLPVKPSGNSPAEPETYTGVYSTDEFFPKRPIEILLNDTGELRVKTSEGEYDLLFCDTTRFLIADETKLPDQRRILKFHVRDGKAWAVQDGRILRREG